MSGLYLLLVLGIWAGLTALIVKGWRRLLARDDVPKRRTHAVFVPLLACWLGVTFWYGGGRKMYYDEKVKELCAKDGGVKVFETVKLPPGMFNRWGQIDFYKPDKGENALGPEYAFHESIEILKTGNPELLRYRYRITRRLDSRILSETVSYQRGGGDLPGPWQPSVFSCPSIQDAGPNALMFATFIKEQ